METFDQRERPKYALGSRKAAVVSGSFNAIFAKAVDKFNATNFTEAARLCRKLLAIDPAHPEALHLLALIAAQSGRHMEAVEFLERVVKNHPYDAEAYANLGVVFKELGRYEESLAAHRRSVNLDPGRATAHNNIGVTLLLMGRTEKAVAAFHRASGLESGYAEAHNNLGLALKLLGRHDESLRAYRKAIDLRPDYPEALNGYGCVIKDLGRYEDAIAAFENALTLQPDNDEALDNLADSLQASGRYDDAIAHYQRALQRQPDRAATYLHLGAIFKASGRPQEAVASYARAIAIKSDYAEAHSNLAAVLKDLGRDDEALALYDKAIAIADGRLEAPFVNKAILLMEHGNTIEASLAIDQALGINPHSAHAWELRCDLKKFTLDDPDIAAMEALLARFDGESQKGESRMRLHFALGKAWMDVEDAPRAWVHLDAGNRLKRGMISYDAVAARQRMAAIPQVMSREFMARFSGVGDPSDVPVFIIGMPRSGTTLIEQILASHPQVFGAGELTLFEDLIRERPRGAGPDDPYPGALTAWDSADFAKLGADYNARVSRLGPGHRRVVDKMPGNFLFAGLIHLVLPNARIIHCRRDPVDTCFSCYSKDFAAELNFSYDLRELGLHYRQYEALMAHWRALIPGDRLLEVCYEDVVEDISAEARRLVAFCGLTWDEACLDFHKTQRPVRTASLLQVRQPVYRSSVQKWKPFAPYLGPLLNALEIAPDPVL